MKVLVTAIKPVKRRKDRVLVEFEDGREPVELAAEVCAAAGVASARPATEEEIAGWLREDELWRCRQRAWALLAYRPRSREELRRALRQRKFPAPTVDSIIAALEEKGHLDDAAFARLVVEQADTSGRAGPRLVRQRLAQKGVRGRTADEALQPLEESENQEAKARRLLLKWNQRPKPEDPAKRRQTAAGFLMRRGFDPDVTWEVVREVLGGES